MISQKTLFFFFFYEIHHRKKKWKEPQATRGYNYIKMSIFKKKKQKKTSYTAQDCLTIFIQYTCIFLFFSFLPFCSICSVFFFFTDINYFLNFIRVAEVTHG